MVKLAAIAIGIITLSTSHGHAAPNSAADEICYDHAVIGHIRRADHFVGLDQLVKLEPGEVTFGGRSDVDIEVEQVVAGPVTPPTLNARVVLTTMFTPKARLLIFLKNGPVRDGEDNTLKEWNGRLVPGGSADHPWRVVLVTSMPMRLDLSGPGLPPRCS